MVSPNTAVAVSRSTQRTRASLAACASVERAQLSPPDSSPSARRTRCRFSDEAASHGHDSGSPIAPMYMYRRATAALTGAHAPRRCSKASGLRFSAKDPLNSAFLDGVLLLLLTLTLLLTPTGEDPARRRDAQGAVGGVPSQAGGELALPLRTSSTLSSLPPLLTSPLSLCHQVSADAKEFIAQCLTYRKDERPDVLKLSTHRYLSYTQLATTNRK